MDVGEGVGVLLEGRDAAEGGGGEVGGRGAGGLDEGLEGVLVGDGDGLLDLLLLVEGGGDGGGGALVGGGGAEAAVEVLLGGGDGAAGGGGGLGGGRGGDVLLLPLDGALGVLGLRLGLRLGVLVAGALGVPGLLLGLELVLGGGAVEAAESLGMGRGRAAYADDLELVLVEVAALHGLGLLGGAQGDGRALLRGRLLGLGLEGDWALGLLGGAGGEVLADLVAEGPGEELADLGRHAADAGEDHVVVLDLLLAGEGAVVEEDAVVLEDGLVDGVERGAELGLVGELVLLLEDLGPPLEVPEDRGLVGLRAHVEAALPTDGEAAGGILCGLHGVGHAVGVGIQEVHALHVSLGLGLAGPAVEGLRGGGELVARGLGGVLADLGEILLGVASDLGGWGGAGGGGRTWAGVLVWTFSATFFHSLP